MEKLNQTAGTAAVISHPTQGNLRLNPSLVAAPYGLEGTDDEDSEGSLVEYWRILRRNLGTIMLASIAGLVLGFLITIPITPVYSARTSLEILTINDDFMNMKQANPTTTVDSSYDTSEEQTQAKLLMSSALIDKVIAKIDPTFPAPNSAGAPMASSGWRHWLHLSDSKPLTEYQRLILKAANSVKVRATARTRLLEVTVSSPDPTLATNFANTLTQEFIAANIEARWSTTQRTSEWLTRELNGARTSLSASENALQTYARESGLIFTDEDNSTNVATEKLQQVQLALSAAIADRITKQSHLELAQASPPQFLSDILNDESLNDTQAKIADLKRQIADLSAIYDPEYSKVRRLKAELDSLQTSFNTTRDDIIARIKLDFQDADRKEKLLEGAYDAQARQVTGQDEKAIQYNILKRDVDSNRQLYDTMLQQMKQAAIASAMRASNIRVVDPAQMDETQSQIWPSFKIDSALGFLVGIMISVVAVIVRDRADKTIQKPGDLKLWAELAELGTIPSASLEGGKPAYQLLSFASSNGNLRNGASSGVPKATPNRYIEGAVGRDGHDPVIVALPETSLIMEAFRSTFTSILFIGENGSRPEVLVFTSANAAEGKTTVASHVARAAAEINFKVLVIDADLRRPRMHKIFGVPNNEGLANLLQGRLEDHDVQSYIHRCAFANLDVLPAGPATDVSSHLLYSPNFHSLLTNFRKDYDMIIVDTPPMLQLTDARVIGRSSDAVVLVARANHTTRDAIVAAKDRLRDDKIRVLGTILNDWNPKISRGGYYGYYQGQKYVKNYTSNKA